MANLNLAAAVRQEGNWAKDGWGPQIPDETTMNTFVTSLITRANNYLQQRVSPAWYALVIAAAVPNAAVWLALLTEAEMHLAQMYLLEAAAGIAESGSDTNPAPFLGSGGTLRQLAADRHSMALDIIEFSRSLTRPGGHIPYTKAATTSGHVIARFDPGKGDPVS